MSDATYCDITRKVQYKKRAAAERARNQMRRLRRSRSRHAVFDRDGGGSLEAFLCEHCGHWHLGRHMTKRRHQK